jgi:hypothetical protein
VRENRALGSLDVNEQPLPHGGKILGPDASRVNKKGTYLS